MTDIFIIAGGGIGGLATALALQNHGFPCQIYERDIDFNSRRQGYSLTIQKNGFEALENLGIGENVRTMGRERIVSGTCTYNNCGDIIFSKPKRRTSSRRFENFAISRQSLRQCLMNELKSDIIQWNKAITRYETIPDDPCHVRIFLSGNSSIVGRALIGCDGVRSSIRKQMLRDDLNYLGVWAINGIAPHDDNKILLNQTIQMIDGKSRLFVKPFSIGKCMWQLTFKVSMEDEMIHHLLDQNDFEGLLNRAKSITNEWHEPIPKLINDTRVSDIRVGPLFDRNPLDTINKDVSCVTMLGDAVHPMSPFKGQGANQALADAVSLVNYLMQYVTEDRGAEKAFAEFEREMLTRSRDHVLRSRLAVTFLHSENALSNENMFEFVRGKVSLEKII
ncbi:unnamed protein product [Rotaria socialis]|uniref:FAD-binding domain-containing protein n=1 Tax=Rotaria socialis TaxID=392032 RepID=A0A817NAA0_9BILA|nr:unnamed protein product [Rotaria socialis]CAF3571663.1 unnamed protein product [Rotaria socialis]CAF3618767.1 unnamed protein product [Rotaria socialis]CAF3703421.1 unnamed protein product [Rotaria socialis]CAF3808922.1 unnamed protein product [Rotaria socialis]